MRARLVGVVVALAVVLAACGGEPPTRGVHASRTVEYESLKHAARNADAVVEIEVDRSGVVEKVGSLPFTVTQARVVGVVKGRFSDATIRLRQLGSAQGDGLAPEGELLTPGRRYVAIVVPFTFEDFAPTGQHVVVGGWQGLYRVQDDLLVATDDGRTKLPRQISRRQFVEAVAS
jgi:hypothetical protein